MSTHSIFDIAGPVMVGPSSSHTAGACKIGQFARALFHKTPKRVTFYLHGSFGEVYKGHATDLALLGGVMKFRTSDERMKDAFEWAHKKKIKYKFHVKDLGHKYHPNTVEVILENRDNKMSVISSSIGGGMIEIVKINDFDVLLKGQAGKYLSLVACHENDPEMIIELQNKLRGLGSIIVNVESTTYRDKTLSILSMEGHRITLAEVMDMEKTEGVEFMRALTKLDKM